MKSGSTIGLDVGLHSIKAVQISRDGDSTRLDGYGTLSIDEFKSDEETFAQQLDELFQYPTHGRLDADEVILCMPRQHSTSTIVTTAPNFKKLSIQNGDLVDYYPLPNDDADVQTWVINSTPDVVVEPIRSAVAIHGMEFGGLGSLLNIHEYITSRSSRHFLHIDHDTSTYIFRSPEICIAQDFVLGGNDTLKSFDRFRQVIEHYENVFSANDHYQNTTLTLSGAVASGTGFVDSLSEKLSIPIESIRPWQHTSLYPLKSMPRSRWPIYSIAIGLALVGSL